MSQKKICLIDGLNMLIRCFSANPALNEKGIHIGAISGFFHSLQKTIKDIQADSVLIVWDGSGGSKKRQEMNSAYKEGRKVPRPAQFNRALDIQFSPEEERESLYRQQRRVIEILNTLPYQQICEDGVEADDIIAFLNTYYSCAEDYLKIIISNDKDFIQLTDKCTILYRPVKHEYITYKSFLATEGIHPNNLALSRALEGDSSDNLIGVKGVGRKTIAKKFPEFANPEFITIDKLVELCESRAATEKSAVKILEALDVVRTNYKIMQLYMPMIPAHTSIRLREALQTYKPDINVSLFGEEMKEEGINGDAYTALIMHGLRVVGDNK